PAGDMAECAHLGDGRPAGRKRPHHREARAARTRGPDAPGRRGPGHRAARAREVRARRVAVLRDSAAVGRWDHRPGRDAHRAGARPVDGLERAPAAPADGHLPDVRSTMLAVARQGNVVHVRLDRPDARNALSPGLIAALTAWAREAGNTRDIAAAVLSGAGPAFCAGADIGWMREARTLDEAANQADAERLADMFEAIARVPFPLVGRAHGAALGGGAGLLAVCDHVVAGPDLSVGFSEVRLGLLPAVIAPWVARRI